MFSILEAIAIIGIIVVQLVIAVRAYKQIEQMKSFLPDGRSSLALKEYEIPADKILELKPSQVVNRITYTPSNVKIVSVTVEQSSGVQIRDEKGRFTSKRVVYSPVHGDVEVDEN